VDIRGCTDNSTRTSVIYGYPSGYPSKYLSGYPSGYQSGYPSGSARTVQPGKEKKKKRKAAAKMCATQFTPELIATHCKHLHSTTKSLLFVYC